MSRLQAYEQALAHLLPQGAAWPRDPASVWMRVVSGLAGPFAELHDFIDQAAAEWQPSTTRTRVGEWEAAVGLPDPCFGPLQTLDARRAAVVARLRGYTGAYADSSPASLGSITAFCAAVGLPATVTYNPPFRVGRNRCGDRLGANGHIYVETAGTDTPFRVGVSRCGDRLVQRAPEAVELECALERVVPARFALHVAAA